MSEKLEVKKRYISLYVENRIGVLAKISGLLAGKSYNMDTLTVGETEDPTVSRMTIGLTIDDITFEQVKKRYISLYVENRIGVLAKISGLLAGKSYNMDTLTVGETEDPTVSRMTIGLTIDDITFEQVKKQLNRCVVVIKVLDFSEIPIHKKELLFIKVSGCGEKDKAEVFRIAQAFGLEVIDYDKKRVLVQCVKTESGNNDMIRLFNRTFPSRIETVRGGSVAIEAISTSTL